MGILRSYLILFEGAVGWRAKDPAVKWFFYCGSTLISKTFLITAAHCSKLSFRSSYRDVLNRVPEIVRLGVEDIVEDEVWSSTRKMICNLF